MVQYKCMHCVILFSKKDNYKKHIFSKKCKHKLDNEIIKYSNYNKLELINDFVSLFIKIKNKKNVNYKCEDCNNYFSSYITLKKHIMNNVCKKSQITPYQKIVEKINKDKDSNKSIKINSINNTNNKNTINNTTNNTINNNTINKNTINNTINNTANINNINLVPYSNIKYDNLPLHLVKKLFELPGEAIPLITKITFFNSKNPKNNVIFCPNIKDSQLFVYTNSLYSPDGWELIDKKDFFEKMIEKQIITMEQIKQVNDEEENPLEIKNYIGFNNMIDAFDTDKTIKNEYVKKINNICYQNSGMVKSIRQTISNQKKFINKITN